MAKTVGKLTALKVARLTEPGMHPDGAGLYLQVTGAGAKSWIYRFSLHGRPREMGLGSAVAVSLLDARTKADDCRRLRERGIDPIEAKKAARAQVAFDVAQALLFKDAAAAYIAAHRAGWRNKKHAQQWVNTLATYAEPVLGAVPVQAIDTALVLKVIEPIWATKTETASRVRNRIEAILDWASARGNRVGENPARWRGHLAKLLPAPTKVKRVRHHPALPYDDVPAFFTALRKRRGVAARALELTILTAARTSETTGATLGEFNTAKKTWTVPPERIKGGREHRKPLPKQACEVIAQMQAQRDPDFPYLFPGGERGEPLSENAMLEVLDRMGFGHVTVHGFRSSFKDWAAECTNYPNEISEMALAHVIGDKTEAAYRRGDLFEKRQRLMDDWATYLHEPESGSAGQGRFAEPRTGPPVIRARKHPPFELSGRGSSR